MSADVRVCALVPTYDNPRTVAATVGAIRAHLPDVVLVDDGSGPAGRAACEALAGDGLVRLERLPVNGGKGAAVKHGLARARELGFSHAFQIDADGQHDIACMPRFLEAARRSPGALVLGHPVYDASAPRHRRVARRLMHFWVGLELADPTAIRDPMIGFRIYPVAAALAVATPGNRMDFDIEVAVLLARAGTPIVNLPVGIRYLAAAEGGVSHFRQVRDNLRFFAMHSRLCSSGLRAWVRRLARRPDRRESRP